MTDSEIALRVRRKMLLSPEQRRKERRETLERKILEQPEQLSREALQQGALRFFLRCFREVEPGLLAELRDIAEKEPGLPWEAAAEILWSLSNRYYLPRTIDVANECLKTLLMWQAFPGLPNSWHFELPEGALADPLGSAKIASTPYPFVFVAEGWNPETETLDAAKKRLLRQFKAAVNAKADKATFWKSAGIDRSEFRLFEASPSLEKLRRNLECLAEKQARGKPSHAELARRLGLTREAVRVGLLEAAVLIGLSEIRNAPPGAPKGRRRE